MAVIRITLQESTGEDIATVALPDDVPRSRLLPALLGRLNLQLVDRQNAPISYRLYLRGREGKDREIGQDETLAQAGVSEGDAVVLSQEAVAGS